MDKEQIIRRYVSIPTGVHVREAEQGEEPGRTIEGYAIVFNTPSEPLWQDEDSEAREVIAPEAVTADFLNGQNIKMTMFHDNQLLLARSNKGKGTLSYTVDEKGVKFSFDAPNTSDGDKALELVRRGDISGCSFMFSTRYYDEDFVERTSKVAPNGCNKITYRVKAVTGIYDFTLAADPYYQDTSVEAREFSDNLRKMQTEHAEPKEDNKKEQQIREMRAAAGKKMI